MRKIMYIFIFSFLSFIANSQIDSLNFLKVGNKAPDFSMVDFKKDSVQLNKLLEKGKVVIVFYRGAWCPYCNKHMSHLQDSLQFIIEKGANILAISPEIEESIENTISKADVTFSILHDEKYSIMMLYGVAFKVSEATLKKYKLFGIHIDEANGNEDNILPVPATFIINQNGTIDFIHFDEDYKQRLSVKEILNHL